MTQDKVTILQPDKAPLAFNCIEKKLVEATASDSMIEQAKAHVLFGSLAYSKQWYQ